MVLENVVGLENGGESHLAHKRKWAVVVDVESLVVGECEWLVDTVGADPLVEAGVLVDVQEGAVDDTLVNPFVEIFDDTDSSNELGGVVKVYKRKAV